MTGGLELTILALRVGVIIAVYAFLGVVLLVIWRGANSGGPADAGRETLPEARLIVVDAAGSGLEPGAEFALSASGTIGRGAPNSIVLPDAAVSARHGRIAFRQGEWWVEDLQSANGTYVNGKRVEGPLLLQDGDEVEVAQVKLRMEIG